MRKNIIITGMPRSGKSSLLNKIIQDINPRVGLVTKEIREKGERIGFELENHNGEKNILAHINFKNNLKVSRYSVDMYS